MSISWHFDDSGRFNFPVLILDNRFKYIASGRNSAGDVRFFRCIQEQTGCQAGVSIGSRYHEEGGGEGWGLITQYLLDYSPLSCHTCLNIPGPDLESFRNCDVQSLDNCFGLMGLNQS